MITPNKVVPFDSSVLGHIAKILNVGPQAVRVEVLFAAVGKYFESVDEFLLALDVLYVLNRIDVDLEGGRVVYAS